MESKREYLITVTIESDFTEPHGDPQYQYRRTESVRRDLLYPVLNTIAIDADKQVYKKEEAEALKSEEQS